MRAVGAVAEVTKDAIDVFDVLSSPRITKASVPGRVLVRALHSCEGRTDLELSFFSGAVFEASEAELAKCATVQGWVHGWVEELGSPVQREGLFQSDYVERA